LSTLKVNSIQHSNGTDALTIDSAGNTSFSGVVTGTPLGNRNLIINGDMRIAQRGTSATGLGNGDGGYHTVDRFRFYEGGTPTCEFTQTQDTDVPTGQGFVNSLKMQCTTAQTSFSDLTQVRIEQQIEAQNLQHLAYGTSNAKTVTLSFWVKSNKTGTYILNIYQADDNRTISKAYTIDTADTWEKKTITIEGDIAGTINNDNGTGWYVIWGLVVSSDYTSGTLQTSWGAYTRSDWMPGQVNLADSTSNYINITGVQLEVGDTATPFEHRPYDMELQRCKRYYYTTYPIGVAPGTVGAYACQAEYAPPYNGNHVATWQHPVSMRATPTMTGYAEDGTSGSFTTGAGNQTAQFYQTTSAVITPFASFNGTYLKLLFTADAEL